MTVPRSQSQASSNFVAALKNAGQQEIAGADDRGNQQQQRRAYA